MLTATFPHLRLRRLRSHPVLRDLIRETDIQVSDLVYPLFLKDKKGERKPLESMPGIDQIPLNKLAEEVQELTQLGITSVLLFGVPANKDERGSSALDSDGIVQEAIQIIHAASKEMLVMADLCLCEYTSHGHCGVWCDQTLDVDNDQTLELLADQAVSLARSGVDVIAPSGMIDGMVKVVRERLDQEGFERIPILSYAIKYASALYGPFREAAEGAPAFGDRRSHQLDPANGAEALREAALDVQEGADILMVKPAHAYLDVIYRVKQAHPQIPLAAYHTSGEYAMIKAAAQKGWLDEQKTVLEIFRGIRRAGADFVITYYAKEIARWLSP